MRETKSNLSILKACGSSTLCDCCLAWGFPSIAMLVISVLASVRIGVQFNERPIIEFCVFVIMFALQSLVYYTVFQYMLTSLCCMFNVSISISHGNVVGVEAKETMVGIKTVDNKKVVKESADNMPKVAIEDAKTMVAVIPDTASNNEIVSITESSYDTRDDSDNMLPHEPMIERLPLQSVESYVPMQPMESAIPTVSTITMASSIPQEGKETLITCISQETKILQESEAPQEPMANMEPLVTNESIAAMETNQPSGPKITELPVLSSEAYQQRNDEYMAELAAEKSRILAIILEYVHYTMACFIEEEDMPALCQEIINWADDSNYTPKSVLLKEELSTIELRHFIWNIGERLGRENGYDGYTRALFAKSLFPFEFSGIEIDTIKNFTVEPRKGRIKLDRPDPDSYEFHSGKK